MRTHHRSTPSDPHVLDQEKRSCRPSYLGLSQAYSKPQQAAVSTYAVFVEKHSHNGIKLSWEFITSGNSALAMAQVVVVNVHRSCSSLRFVVLITELTRQATTLTVKISVRKWPNDTLKSTLRAENNLKLMPQDSVIVIRNTSC